MGQFKQILACALLCGVMLNVEGGSTFAGSSVTSDSSGTRSVLISGKNGVGVIQSRTGGGASGVSAGSGTYAGAGSGGPISFAGPAGAYAGPGGAYASAGGAPWGFPYWNGAGSGAYAGSDDYPYDSYAPRSGIGSYGGGGSGVGVYSSSDSNGIQSRFASVGPGGQATIVEQNGNEAPRVYTYRGVYSASNEDLN